MGLDSEGRRRLSTESGSRVKRRAAPAHDGTVLNDLDDDSGDAPGETLGTLLRGLRESAALSQQELAGKARIAQGTLSAYERGSREPSWRMFRRITAAAGVQPRVEFEALWSDVDAEIERMRALDVAGRIRTWEKIDADMLFSALRHVRYQVEGLAAASLQGVPVPVTVVDLGVLDEPANLDRLSDAIEGLYGQRWSSAYGYYGFVDPDPRVEGEMEWRGISGRFRVRLVSGLRSSVRIRVEGRHVAVMPVCEVESGDHRVRRVLERVRMRLREPAGGRKTEGGAGRCGTCGRGG